MQEFPDAAGFCRGSAGVLQGFCRGSAGGRMGLRMGLHLRSYAGLVHGAMHGSDAGQSHGGMRPFQGFAGRLGKGDAGCGRMADQP